MAHSEKTFLLDENWDIVVKGGAFMLLSGKRATTQNVANEIKLFKNDAWIAKDEGNAWFDIQLAKSVRRLATSDALRKSALRVDQVKSVESLEVKELDFSTRTLKANMVIVSGGERIDIQI